MSVGQKTALVTGAARNIGLAISQRLAEAGYRVAMTARSHEELSSQAEALQASGAQTVGIVGDALDEHSVAGVVAEAEKHFGSIDVLVNCAAARHHGPLTETSLEDWNRIMGTTLTGAFLFSRAVLPGMVGRRWGRIVNLAGMSGQTGASERAALVSAKAGLMGFTRAVAIEYAAAGITCNAISPGLIDTQRPTTSGDQEVAARHYAERAAVIPVGRLGTTDEIAALCEFLCSEESGFITGQVIGANGGLRL